MPRLLILLFMAVSVLSSSVSFADQRTDPREQALSDALDFWREGRFGQLYDSLSNRSGMTRERFIDVLQDAAVRPSCCHKKLNGFRLLSEKKSTARVYAKLGMEGGPGIDSSQSRDFTLDYEEGRWKMRMGDIKALAGQTRYKKKN
jgi:hypothetical protein